MRTLLKFGLLLLIVVSCQKPVPPNNENDNLDWNKKIAVAYVHSYASLLGEAVLLIENDSAKISFIQNAIKAINFYPDSSGYFYVYDYNCINIAHAKQSDLVGKNLYDYKDSKGKFVIRELSQMAQNGGGFVDFYWIKPGETGEKEKLGYVEAIPNTNYFIGSGVYLE